VKKILISVLVFVIWGLVNVSSQSLHLVRIEGLPEQAVGQKILSDIFSKAGFTVDFEAMPGLRAKALSNTGEKDGETARIFGYGASAPTMVRVATPYYYLESAVYIRKASKVSIKTKDDLKNYKIGIIRGVQHTIDLTAGLSNVTVVDNSEALFKMLNSERFDVALTSKIDGDMQIQLLKLTNIDFLISLAKLDLFVYLNEKNKGLVSKIDGKILELSRNGDLEKMRIKYEKEYLSSIK